MGQSDVTAGRKGSRLGVGRTTRKRQLSLARLFEELASALRESRIDAFMYDESRFLNGPMTILTASFSNSDDSRVHFSLASNGARSGSRTQRLPSESRRSCL